MNIAIPDIYINATLEEKQLLLRMIIDEITYAEGGILQVKCIWTVSLRINNTKFEYYFIFIFISFADFCVFIDIIS